MVITIHDHNSRSQFATFIGESLTDYDFCLHILIVICHLCIYKMVNLYGFEQFF